jgi:type VI secretion system secreted protein Hcp
MATQFYVEVEGVKGSSADADHKGWMDATNWHVGAHHPGGFKHGGAGSTGKTAFTDLSFSTHLDGAWPDMHLFCSNGKTIPKVKLECVKEAGDGKIKYLKITLENCIVSSASSNTSGDRPSADYSFNFAKMTVDYTTQTKSGSAGPVVSHNWDVNTNKGG